MGMPKRFSILTVLSLLLCAALFTGAVPEQDVRFETPHDAVVSQLFSGRTFQSFVLLSAQAEPLELIPELSGKPLALYYRYPSSQMDIVTIVGRNPPCNEQGRLLLSGLRPGTDYYLLVLDDSTAEIDRFVFDLRVLSPEIRSTAVTPDPALVDPDLYRISGAPLLSERRLPPAVKEPLESEPILSPGEAAEPEPEPEPPAALPEKPVEPAPALTVPEPIPPDPIPVLVKERTPSPAVIALGLLFCAASLLAACLIRTRSMLRKHSARLEREIRGLEQRLGESGRMLEQKRGEALELAAQVEDQKRRMKQFIQELTHELRIPVSIIKGYANILTENIINGDQIRTVYLRKISDKAEDISALFSRLLVEARVESGDFLCEYCDLNELISEVLADFSPLAGERNIRVLFETCEDGLWLPADQLALSQALQNILQNSLKYMGRPGTVTVTLAKADGDALIVVRDDGNGMRAELVPHIFDRSFRSGTAGRYSSGLGLHLVWRIAALHGGKVWAKSASGDGMTVFLLLPLGKPGEPVIHP